MPDTLQPSNDCDSTRLAVAFEIAKLAMPSLSESKLKPEEYARQMGNLVKLAFEVMPA